MIAITYKEIDDLMQTDAAALYGFPGSWGLGMVLSTLIMYGFQKGSARHYR